MNDIIKNCFIITNNLTNTTTTCCHNTYDNKNNDNNNNSSNNTHNCTNTTTKLPDWPPQPWNNIYVSLMFATVILVIVSNVGVIYKLNPFLKRPKRHSNIELLILYLSASDLGTVFFLTADIYDNIVQFKNWPFGWFGCKTMYPSFNVSLCVSVCVLVVMSVDRCHSITAPLRKKYPRKNIHAAAIISIGLSFAVNWFQFKQHDIETKSGVVRCVHQRHDYSFLRNKIIVTCVRDLIYFLVFTVTAYLISNSLRRHSLLVSSNRNNNNNSSKDSSTSQQNRDRKADVILMLITMETVFGILVLPYDIFDVAMMVSRLPGSDPIVFT